MAAAQAAESGSDSTVTLLIPILTVLLGGGFVGAMIQLYRAKPDRDSVVVTATKNAAEILKGLNDSLYAELERERLKCAGHQARVELLEKRLRDAGLDDG
jgi:hypothetical protein